MRYFFQIDDKGKILKGQAIETNADKIEGWVEGNEEVWNNQVKATYVNNTWAIDYTMQLPEPPPVAPSVEERLTAIELALLDIAGI
ncbi:MAG: hypothetical protein QJR05_08225 [Thermoanaerobacterium sp.]|nr:hypothetical protein [Thermoanaerobacterium sp.]